MKVFLSWSSEQSHKVALVFRDWLPSVIQSIEPYVSSEDIDKGARWSTDIAQELEDSSYGILCVTKENMSAPWLTFEAGALSKTMDKSFVSPFLFDIKRSEVQGPILQFQSTIFEKGDIKKLVEGLNKASEQETLSDERLTKAFDVWYPTLEEELNKLKVPTTNGEKDDSAVLAAGGNELLEEILDISRNNQKLLRNPDSVSKSDLELIQTGLDELKERMRRPMGGGPPRRRRLDPMMIDEMLSGSPKFHHGYSGFLMVLSYFRDDYPWVYEAGVDAVRVLRTSKSKKEKVDVTRQFEQLLEFSFENPMIQDRGSYQKELRMYGRKLYFMLRESFEVNY